MKKVFLIAALAMLTGTIALDARAQSTPAPEQQPDPKELEFVQSWYEGCIGRKPIDEEKCYQLSKELTEKHPKADPKYLEFANKKIAGYKYDKASTKFNTALKDFYGSKPDGAKLEAFFTAGDEFLEIESDPQSPNHLYIIGYQALAAQVAVMADAYKNYDKVKPYFDRALKAFETLNPGKYQKEYTELNLPNLRDLIQANLNQCLGYMLTQTSPDQPDAQAQALAYIEKSTKVRSQANKDIGWKDPNNYQLRRNIYLKQYQALSKQYAAMTDEQKTSDAGKALIKQINEVLDKKLIPEDARLIAVASKPELKDVKNDATEEFNNFWKFRVDDPTKTAAYLKSFEADPTVEGPPVPAKADDGTGAAIPNAASGTNKLTAGSSGVPGATTGTATSTTTGSKTTTKGKTTKKKTRRQ
ncbi:MAG: hypothetical protein J2P41_01210 [Blastocatellia bacterium]|nr:hypothetical protein [Blastocatellia bacterium]